MSSKQTDGNPKRVQVPDDFTLSQMVGGRTKSEKPTEENGIEAVQPNDTKDSLQTESGVSIEPKEPLISTTAPKRSTTKQRKESFEEYRQTFLTIPKLEDRKPVFISCEVRDRIDEIVHRLGGRGRSVSGFIENLARHHLEIYQEDVEQWKKL